MFYLREALLAVTIALVVFWTSGCESSEGTKGDGSRQQQAASSPEKSHHDEGASAHAGDDHAETAPEAKGHGRHHDFEDPKKYAKKWNSEERDEWQKPQRVLELLGAEPGETVVDLGTGTGYFLPHLSRAVGSKGTVYALDVSEEMLEYVDSEVRPDLPHDNVETRLVERDEPGLEPESVDHILMVNTWHHIKDRVGYAEKMLAALKPGGSFVDVDYTMETEMGPPKKIRLTPDEAVAELEKAGFNAEIVDESLPKQYVVVATKPED